MLYQVKERIIIIMSKINTKIRVMLLYITGCWAYIVPHKNTFPVTVERLIAT